MVGVARAPDLVCDLLQNGRINPTTLDRRPLSFSVKGSVLDLVEKLRDARVPMAIINGGDGTPKGVVTSTDLIETILSKGT